MTFDGTIIITDPCYLNDSNNPETEKALYNLYYDSDCGKNLKKYGCSDYISDSTICGDWSCITFNGNPEVYLDKIRESKKTGIVNITDKSIGRFCADSGQVCVVYLSEILKINPDFLEWADTHTWCVTIIPQFNGTVTREVYNNEVFIVGKGTTDFYTTQFGYY